MSRLKLSFGVPFAAITVEAAAMQPISVTIARQENGGRGGKAGTTRSKEKPSPREKKAGVSRIAAVTKNISFGCFVTAHTTPRQ